MLTLANMNPCGLTILSGLPGSGKTTILRSLIAEVSDAPPFVLDLEQENWTDPRPGIYYMTDPATLGQLKKIISEMSPPVSTYFINGVQSLECPGTLLEGLADLWVIAKERGIRIIMTLQTRRPALGDDFKTVTEDGGPTVFGVTDGFIHNLSASVS